MREHCPPRRNHALTAWNELHQGNATTQVDDEFLVAQLSSHNCGRITPMKKLIETVAHPVAPWSLIFASAGLVLSLLFLLFLSLNGEVNFG